MLPISEVYCKAFLRAFSSYTWANTSTSRVQTLPVMELRYQLIVEGVISKSVVPYIRMLFNIGQCIFLFAYMYVFANLQIVHTSIFIPRPPRSIMGYGYYVSNIIYVCLQKHHIFKILMKHSIPETTFDIPHENMVLFIQEPNDNTEFYLKRGQKKGLRAFHVIWFWTDSLNQVMFY